MTEDLIVWPNNTWCFRYELEEYSYMSDDYYVIKFDSREYSEFLNEFAPWKLDE